MRSQYLLVLVALSFPIIAKGQDTTYTSMNRAVLARNPNMKDESMQQLYYRNLQFLFDAFTGYTSAESGAKKEKEQAALRLDTLKKKMSRHEKYPDSIATGWHAAALTDNQAFYKDVKVFVSKNTVRQLAIENCISIACTSKEQVKNAASVVTFTNINSGFDVLYVYFINDLDSIALVEEPMQPGYVCFWTSKNQYLNERLLINGVRRDFISKLHETEPECIEKGVPFYMMKPGMYRLRVTRTGNDKEAGFEIKPGMCLKYRLK